MIFKTIAYLKFLITATNQHGVHSPFVYDFVTKGLYQKSPINNIIIPEIDSLKATKKQQILLKKIATYFQIDGLQQIDNNSILTLDKQYKSFYINNLKSKTIKQIIDSKSFFIIILPNIYQSKTTYKKWLEIINHQPFTISVDLFYLGLLFYRPQQKQEHFKIRV